MLFALGYTLSGSVVTQTCLSDGTWTDAVFQCVIDDCGVPGSPLNGDVTYPSTVFGNTATYTCHPGNKW